MRPYSLDLRERALADSDRGMPTKAVAEKYSVSPSWVRRLKQRRRETGEVTPRRGKVGRKPSLPAYAERLRAAVERKPDSTLAELKARLGLAVSLSTLWCAVAALGLTLKKSRPTPPSNSAPT